MTAYIIARVNVTDPEKYKGYMALSPGAIAAQGGRYLVRGGEMQTLEGEPESRRVVVLEFPTLEAAKAFYESAEYTAAREKRGELTVETLLEIARAREPYFTPEGTTLSDQLVNFNRDRRRVAPDAVPDRRPGPVPLCGRTADDRSVAGAGAGFDG